MILSAMSCFAGIIAGILSFAHFSAFERFNRSFAAGIMFFISSKSFLSRCLCRQIMNSRSHLNFSFMSPPALFVLLAMAIYTGVTVNFLGKRFGDWRFSWSYILGWVALLMTFFAGQQMGFSFSLMSNTSCSFDGTSAFCFCRYILHVCLQDAWMPSSGRRSLKRERNSSIHSSV